MRLTNLRRYSYFKIWTVFEENVNWRAKNFKNKVEHRKGMEQEFSNILCAKTLYHTCMYVCIPTISNLKIEIEPMVRRH